MIYAPYIPHAKKQHRSRSAALLLGPPGSGKTSLANAVAEDESIATIKAGALLKQRLRTDSEMSRQLKSFLDTGELVPTKWIETVLADQLGEIIRQNVLFDGFPRTEEQVPRFFALLRDHSLHLRSVVILTLDVEEAIKRLGARRVCSECGAVFNLANDPPEQPDTCDQCGGELIRREDDQPEVVRKRYHVYERQTKPVVAFFTREFPEIAHPHAGTAPTSKAANEIQKELTKQ